MKSQITILILCLVFAFAKAQSVSTVTDGIFFDGLGVDSTGKIYCSNYAGSQVYTYDPATESTSEFATGLTTPNGIGVTPDDHIYVCEATVNRITVYNTDGTQSGQITGLNNPTGIKYDTQEDDLIWVSYNGNSLNFLDPDDDESGLIYSGTPLNGPSGIAFVNGVTYVSNYNDRKIFRLESDDTLTEIAQLPAGADQNNFCGFLTAKGDKLYATQIGENRIYQIDPQTGGVSLFSGSELGNDDGDLSEATYSLPNGILGDDATDRIYVSDAGTSNLRIIDEVSLTVDTFARAPFSINLYPNPVGDTLTIEASSTAPEKYSLKVLNELGQLVTENVYDIAQREVKTQLSTVGWAKGTYIIQITAGDEVLTRKIVK